MPVQTAEHDAFDGTNDPDVEQVQDSRFDWATAVNSREGWYYSQFWVQRGLRETTKGGYCVVKRKDDCKYYVSHTEDEAGAEDIGPFNSLEDAASVCVMKNYGN